MHTDKLLFLGGLALAGTVLLAAPAAAQIHHHSFFCTSSSGQLGRAVGAAYDVNADGINDVLLGEPHDDDFGDSSGSAYVYSGADWSLLLAWHGEHALDQFGASVAGLGDVNGDGHADIAVGAPYAGANGSEAGSVRVYSGQNGALLWAVNGAPAHIHLGSSIALAGDANGDGIADLIVGAPDYNGILNLLPGAGRALLLSGVNGATLLTFTGGVNDHLGAAVSGAGDVNGDGRADVILAAPTDDTLGELTGRIDVRSGSNGALLFSRYGPHAASFFGSAVGGAGDVDGDGLADVVVGAYGENGFAGAVHVYRGPNGAASWTFTGDAIEDRLGSAVAGAGDVDRDGHADLIVGTYPQGSEKPPYVRVLSGATGATLYFTVTGPSHSGFGLAVAPLTDVTGDGWLDIVIGAPFNYDGFHFGSADVYSPLWCQEDKGFGGPGLAELSMCGTLLGPGGQADLLLQDAAPNRPALLVASSQLALTPFKGGILLPNLATGLSLILATNGNGAILLPGIPGGLGNFDACLQVAIQDPAQPQGVAISNAVLAHFEQ